MTALASALTVALIDFAWQGVLVACLLWLALFMLRNRSANARYVASCMALLTMFAIPIVTAYVSFHGAAGVSAYLEVAGPATRVTPHSDLPIPAPAMGWLLYLQMWALPVWSAGVLLFSCRLIFAARELSAFKRSGTPVSHAVRNAADSLVVRMGLGRTVRILMSTLADAPTVAGFLRPVILLPVSSVMGLPPQQLEAILAHELAHIHRYDPLMNALQILVETLLFYHPAVWWTSARIRHERELCCDDLAVACCGDALCYARALTALEKLRGVGLVLAIGSTGGSLLYRIRRVMGERPSNYTPSRLSGILAVALAIGCIAVNVGGRIQAQDRPSPTSGIFYSPGVQVDTGGAQVVEPILYPRPAAEKAIQGTVVVQLDVDAQGGVSDARVLSGPPELRKAVLRPVLTWRFQPEGTASTRQISVAFQAPLLQELDVQQLDERQKVTSATLAEEQAAQARALAHRDAQRQRQDQRTFEHNAAELQEQLMAAQAEYSREDRKQKASEMRANTEQLQLLFGQQALAGRELSRIDFSGVPDDRREQLVNQLPVHIGDKLSVESIESLRRTIHGFDGHLAFQLVPQENYQVVLRIAPAGIRTYWAFDRRNADLAPLSEEIARVEAQLDSLRRTYTENHPDMIDLETKLKALQQKREQLMSLTLQDANGAQVATLQTQIASTHQQLTALKLSLTSHPDPIQTDRIQKMINMLEIQQQALEQLVKQQQLIEQSGQPGAAEPPVK